VLFEAGFPGFSHGLNPSNRNGLACAKLPQEKPPSLPKFNSPASAL
jgi:hypothetical protein